MFTAWQNKESCYCQQRSAGKLHTTSYHQDIILENI